MKLSALLMGRTHRSSGPGAAFCPGSLQPYPPQGHGHLPSRARVFWMMLLHLANLTAPCDELSVGSRGSSRGVNSDGHVRGSGAPLPALEKTCEERGRGRPALWPRSRRRAEELCPPRGGPAVALRGQKGRAWRRLPPRRSSPCRWVPSVTAVPTTRRAKATGAAHGTWRPE